MYNHEPANYHCPFCFLAQGGEDEINGPEFIVYSDAFVTAYVSPKWWPKNPGNVIVIPNDHFENLYDLPNLLGHKIFDLTKAVAIAIKQAYACDGISVRQHNEPAGNQDVWHFHQHVFPRYIGDELYLNHKKSRWVEKEERLPYVAKLRHFLDNKSL